MRIDADSSNRISMLRFPLIVGVVFIHAYGSTVSLTGGEVGVAQTSFLTDLVPSLISQGLARVAVPLFFLMSGYLFFLSFNGSLDNYIAKLKSRFRTLFIPFLFWNILIFVLLAIARSLPETREYFTAEREQLGTFGFLKYIDAIFGFSGSPASYQFWFIRDLMIVVLFSPIFYLCNKLNSAVFLLVAALVWFFDIWPVYVPSAMSVLFFFLGSALAYHGKSLFLLDRHGAIIASVYVLLVSADALTKGHVYNPYLNKIGILFGLAAVLYVTKSLVRREKARSVLLKLGGCSFFVYAVHEPPLTVIRKLSYKMLEPSSSVAVIGLYFLIPLFVIGLSVAGYYLLKPRLPRLIALITGGR